MKKEEFGKLFNFLCDKKGLNDSNIAKDLGVDRATVGRWRKGERTPNLSLLPIIANYFNISMDVFTYDKAEEYIERIDPNTNIYGYDIASTFTTFDDAMQFIIRSPYASAFGGYDLKKMSDEEIIDFANELSGIFKIIAKKRQK